MTFTSGAYAAFLVALLAVHWALPTRRARNALLLAAGYAFYGFVHPWFCLALAGATLATYVSALGIAARPARRKLFLGACLVADLGALAAFKYFGFFHDNVRAVLAVVGLSLPGPVAKLVVPVGISFYTLLLVGYVLDVYWKRLEPCRDLLDFALFSAFFPQVVSGPIERGGHLLPQVRAFRKWDAGAAASAVPLLVTGFLKKLVVGDNVGVWVDRLFMMDRPPLPFLLLGAFGFAIQIYADFSGYTDIARGSARLFGFELFENFRSPYAAISPSDFWRRWHISLSTWLRDYVFLPAAYAVMRPIRSARVLFLRTESFAYAVAALMTMALAGLWHGAAWTFVAWGVYHGLLMVIYHLAGIKGSWRPRGIRRGFAWAVMFLLTLAGWALFRAPSLGWLASALRAFKWGLSGPQAAALVMVLGTIMLFASPLVLRMALDRWFPRSRVATAAYLAAAIVIIAVFHLGTSQDFIYVRF